MSRRRPAVLAVDGGNSKADLALVAADGTLLALESGPTISHQQVPMSEVVARLRALSDQARRAGGAGEARLGSYCVAGADYPSDVSALRRAFTEAGVSRRVVVRNDAYAALRAGASAGWGVVVVCGAGVNAAGSGPDGRTARLAGIGDYSGDWGGGFGLGREALAAAVRARDGRGPATRLAAAVPHHFGLAHPSDVTRALYDGRLEPRRLEELSPVLFAIAADGDRVAGALVDRLADELATMAVAIARRLRLVRREFEVVLTGGVLRAGDRRLLDRLEERVTARIPGARLTTLRARPVLGAALLGLDELGARPGGASERRLRSAFD